MAQQGYWVVCEDLYAGNKNTQEPALCMGHVQGFEYTNVMAGSRREVLAGVRRKLKDNIRFFLDCYHDVPPPSDSDNPPQNTQMQNAAFIFLDLKEIGVHPDLLIPLTGEPSQ